MTREQNRKMQYLFMLELYHSKGADIVRYREEKRKIGAEISNFGVDCIPKAFFQLKHTPSEEQCMLAYGQASYTSHFGEILRMYDRVGKRKK